MKRTWKYSTRHPIVIGPVALLPMPGDKFAVVDTADLELCEGRNWSGDYPRSGIDKLHRIIVGAADNQLVDHRNGITTNCCRYNLRITDPSGNARNRAPTRTSKSSPYKGVSWREERKSWMAHIRVGGILIKRKAQDEIVAARLYDKLAMEHFGDFARLNFPHKAEGGDARTEEPHEGGGFGVPSDALRLADGGV